MITGEQGEKYCKTLPALFRRCDSEFSGGVPIGKTNIDSLNLLCHKVYIYYETFKCTQNKCHHELYEERIIYSYSILCESVITKPNIKSSGMTETLVLMCSKNAPSYFLED